MYSQSKSVELKNVFLSKTVTSKSDLFENITLLFSRHFLINLGHSKREFYRDSAESYSHDQYVVVY